MTRSRRWFFGPRVPTVTSVGKPFREEGLSFFLCVARAVPLFAAERQMRLKRFLLRYFPPGLVLEYERSDGSRNSKVIDLLTLGPECVIWRKGICARAWRPAFTLQI